MLITSCVFIDYLIRKKQENKVDPRELFRLVFRNYFIAFTKKRDFIVVLFRKLFNCTTVSLFDINESCTTDKQINHFQVRYYSNKSPSRRERLVQKLKIIFFWINRGAYVESGGVHWSYWHLTVRPELYKRVPQLTDSICAHVNNYFWPTKCQ